MTRILPARLITPIRQNKERISPVIVIVVRDRPHGQNGRLLTLGNFEGLFGKRQGVSLDELEASYRARLQGARKPVFIVAMQIGEANIRALRPRLAARGESLSEHGRTLIGQNVTWEDWIPG